MMNNYMKLVLTGLIGLSLVACGNTSSRKPREAIPLHSDAMDPVQLNQAIDRPALGRLINIGIPVFTVQKKALNTEATNSAFGAWVTDDILDIERQYLPIILRNTLVQSNQWGAVRILPKTDPSTDLQLFGTVLHSDGAALTLRIVAVDSMGRQWLDKTYKDQYANKLVGDDEPPVSTSSRAERRESKPENAFSVNQCRIDDSGIGFEPFANLYRQIANDLFAVKKALSNEQLSSIRRIAEIRHAQDLAPNTFGGLTSTGEDGLLKVDRLLANDDPMQIRVNNMRARHHLFIDTIDEHYLGLHQKMRSIYRLWSRYSCERDLEILMRRMSGEDEVKRIRAGGFSVLSNSYRRYNTNKIFEQEWDQLAKSFTVELSPVIVELNDNVYTLTGSVEQQYKQWRDLLSEFYRLENTD